MKTYTLHLPSDAQAGDRDAFERAVLVKDGFSWGAFFFTFLWFFVHRLWLAGLAVMVALFAVGFLLRGLELTATSATIAQILIHTLIGLEANSLRRWTLERRGQPTLDVVTGHDSDEAAAKAFDRWIGSPAPAQRRSGRAGAGPLPTAAPYGGQPPVIGLFPDAEGRR